jgi:hypothetical protein
MSSALNNFGEEFRAHGLEGVCRSDSFLTSASPQTEKR